MVFDLGRRAEKVRNTVLAGSSTALDVLYELTGRRVRVLQKGAAFLYDLSVHEEEVAPVSWSPDLQAADDAPAKAAAPAAAEAPEPAAAEAPEPVVAEPAEPAELEAAPATPAPEVAVAPLAETAADPPAQETPALAEAPVPEPALREDLPIEGYDEMTVNQVIHALDGLDRDALLAVQAHEAGHKKRVTIDRAIRKLLDA